MDLFYPQALHHLIRHTRDTVNLFYARALHHLIRHAWDTVDLFYPRALHHLIRHVWDTVNLFYPRALHHLIRHAWDTVNLFYARPHRVWGLGEQPPTSQFPFLTCVLQLQVRCQMMEIVPPPRRGLRPKEVDSSLFTWVSKTSVKPILGCVSQCVVKFVASLTQCILNGDFNARQTNDCCETHPWYI